MNKKIFIGFLFLISLLVLSGGCGSSSKGPITSDTNVNSAWEGAWISSSSGSAEISATNNSDDSLSELTEAFGEITDDMLETDEEKALYEEYKKQAAGEPEKVNASVTNTMLIFEDSDISKDKGTAKMTAVFIFSSDDVSYIPMLFNGVTLATTRSQINAWTAEYSNGDITLSMNISMPSNEDMNISGTIKYLGYDCGFTTTVNKNAQASSIKPAEILDGVWKFESNTQGGGYIASDSDIASVVPENFFMVFSGTKEENSKLTSIIRTSSLMSIKFDTGDESDFQSITSSSDVTITKINGDLYKLTEGNGAESFVYVENTDEIFVFKTDTDDDNEQSCVYLPLKKISFDIAAAMGKTWTAVGGGGYLHLDDPETFFEAGDMKAVAEFLQDISFTLKLGSLSFSNITSNDATITATSNFDTSLTASVLNMYEDINTKWFDNEQVTFTHAGNILEYKDGNDILYISFISDTEAVACIESSEQGEGNFKFVIEFSAN